MADVGVPQRRMTPITGLAAAQNSGFLMVIARLLVVAASVILYE
jgi:hypothetical protein